MKKIFFLLSFTILMFACNKDTITGSGNVISQQRNITGFSGVEVNGSTKAFITLGINFTATVKGYENLLSYLETNVVNGVLQVGFKNKAAVRNDNTEIYVTLPALNYIQSNGDAAISVTGEITGSNQLKAIANGSANINIEKGNANEFDGAISGNGNIFALGFKCEDAYVKISGNGNLEISVSNKLDATISGNGKVYYHGSPVITTHISGNGQVLPK